MVMTFRELPDSPFFENMDPLIKVWLFESWIQKRKQKLKDMKDQGILIGSFTNPEAANKMYKADNPDYISTEEDFEKSSEYVREQALKDIEMERAESLVRQTRRRKKKKIKKS